MRRHRRVAAVSIFFAFTAPLGIVAHLVSELAGLGWHDDADVFLSARHGYLALFALAALVALAFAIRSVPKCERRARVAELVESLPFRGTGSRFTALAFVAQFAFFAITQLGEGCPLCGGDIVVGTVAAAIAALCGAIAIAFGKRRVLEFVLAIVSAYVAVTRERVFRADATLRRRPLALAARRASFSFRYRPPPHAAN